MMTMLFETVVYGVDDDGDVVIVFYCCCRN